MRSCEMEGDLEEGTGRCGRLDHRGRGNGSLRIRRGISSSGLARTLWMGVTI